MSNLQRKLFGFKSSSRVFQYALIAVSLQLIANGFINAQDNSPYSRFGLGDQHPGTNILSGVVMGMAKEIDGFIDTYKERYGNFNVHLTGGDLVYLAPHLKNQIFADPELIFKGLYAISEVNNQ